MLHLPEKRSHAFAIHLFVSLLLFAILSAIIYFLWYPGFLFQTEGGWQGIRLIAGVDLVIGPLLTLIVYDKYKSSIKFDLTCIAVLQAACVVGGMGVVWYTKPMSVAYADGSFYTANRLVYESAEIDTKDIDFLKNTKHPVWVNIELPSDPVQRAYILTVWSFTRPINTAVNLYQPYSEAIKLLPKEGLSYEEAKVQWGVDFKPNDSKVRFYQLRSRFESRFLAVDSETGEVIKLLHAIPEITPLQIERPNAEAQGAETSFPEAKDSNQTSTPDQ